MNASNGKTVLITGAAKRLGADIARMLHGEGFNVMLHYRNSGADAGSLCAELNQKRPDSARTHRADLSAFDEIRGLADAAVGAWGGLCALVNNASVFYPTALSEVTESQWDELLSSNLKTPFFLSKTLFPALKADNGCIVNIIDIHAERGLKGYPVYSIAKAGLAAMTKILAKEMGPRVRVNGISPGAILWPERDMAEEEKNKILERVVLQRTGLPADIAKAVRFLIMDADYLTGQIIAVDGGRSLFT
ncbi:MAG: pteridine reductase [Gammaproteobacteria bacterium]